MTDNFSIESSTKVAALLDEYPELEDVLIGIAPPFKKLKNPLLRKSVAKVASLQQAAAVARIPLVDMLNTLRAAVGQESIDASEAKDPESYFGTLPDWFDESKIVASFDEDDGGDKMPVTLILKRAVHMQPGDIIQLNTTFLPAPGIDVMKQKGYLAWTTEESRDSIKTYFAKPVAPG